MKARMLAARQQTSIPELLASQFESLVREDDSYKTAKRQALALLRKGFHMGGVILTPRARLHER